MNRLQLNGLQIPTVSALLLAFFAILQQSIQAGITSFAMITAISGFFGIAFILNLMKITATVNIIIPVCVVLSLVSLFVISTPYNLVSLLWLSPLFCTMNTWPKRQWVPGITLALSCTIIGFLLPSFSVYLLSSMAAFISIFVIFIRKNSDQGALDLHPILWPKKSLNTIFLFNEILLWLSNIFLVVLLPLYGDIYHTAGFLIGIFLMLTGKPLLLRYGKTKTVHFLLGSLFFFSFLFMITLGFFARTFLWYACVSGILLALFSGMIYIILSLIKQYGRKQDKEFASDFVIQNVGISAILIFCLSQIPALDYWTERLVEVDLPVSVIPLALGQYLIKNLTIPAALSVVFTGYLYLNRRGIL